MWVMVSGGGMVNEDEEGAKQFVEDTRNFGSGHINS